MLRRPQYDINVSHWNLKSKAFPVPVTSDGPHSAFFQATAQALTWSLWTTEAGLLHSCSHVPQSDPSSLEGRHRLFLPLLPRPPEESAPLPSLHFGESNNTFASLGETQWRPRGRHRNCQWGSPCCPPSSTLTSVSDRIAAASPTGSWKSSSDSRCPFRKWPPQLPLDQELEETASVPLSPSPVSVLLGGKGSFQPSP